MNSRLTTVQCDSRPLTIPAMMNEPSKTHTSVLEDCGLELLTLSEAAQRLPRVHHKRIHVSTLWRWCRKGLRGIRLEYVKVGRKIMVTPQGLERFFNALAQADTQQDPQLCFSAKRRKRRRCSNTQRERSIQEADAVLKKAGILI